MVFHSEESTECLSWLARNDTANNGLLAPCLGCVLHLDILSREWETYLESLLAIDDPMAGSLLGHTIPLPSQGRAPLQ